jgi:hypothetical protein
MSLRETVSHAFQHDQPAHDQTHLPVAAILDTLSDQHGRRWRVIDLVDHYDVVTLDYLACQLAAAETGSVVTTAEVQEPLVKDLAWRHLPALEEAGALRFVARTDEVHATEQTPAFAAVVDAAVQASAWDDWGVADE